SARTDIWKDWQTGCAPIRRTRTPCASCSRGDFRVRSVKEDPMLSIVGWILFGLIVGVLAKLLMPGRDPGGIVLTAALGGVGAMVGGLVGRLLGLYESGEGAGYIMATIGAILVLFVYRQIAVRA